MGSVEAVFTTVKLTAVPVHFSAIVSFVNPLAIHQGYVDYNLQSGNRGKDECWTAHEKGVRRTCVIHVTRKEIDSHSRAWRAIVN